MAFCTQCGNNLTDDMQFCTNCGTPRPEGTAPAALTPDPVAAAAVADGGDNIAAQPETTSVEPAAGETAVEEETEKPVIEEKPEETLEGEAALEETEEMLEVEIAPEEPEESAVAPEEPVSMPDTAETETAAAESDTVPFTAQPAPVTYEPVLAVSQAAPLADTPPEPAQIPAQPAVAAPGLESKKTEIVKTGNFFWSTLLAAVPIIGLIFIIVWACGGTKFQSKSNWAKSKLIYLLIGVILAIVAIIVFALLLANPTFKTAVDDFLAYFL